jgi:hypothetical protein
LIVFVTVTALVALGIALAQGCQGPTRGLGSPSDRTVPAQQIQETGAERHLAGG